MTGRRLAVLALAGVAACATPAQVQRVETRVAVVEREQARGDSARAADLARITVTQQQLMDSLVAGMQQLQQSVATSGRETASQFTEVRREMLQLAESLNLNTAKLNQFRTDLESAAAAAASAAAPPPAVDTSHADSTAADSTHQAIPTADALYSMGQRSLNMGAINAAQMAYRQLVKTYPTSPLMPKALLSLGESFSQPDSASYYYNQVVSNFADSPQAATALYKLGGIAEQKGDITGAKAYYQRIVDQYKTADEYDLAVQWLKQHP